MEVTSEMNINKLIASKAKGLANRAVYFIPNDALALRIKYRLVFGKKLNLDRPISYNEKLQWLKLFDRKPEYTTYVDKYGVKQWVGKTIGDEYVIPTLAVYDHADDVDISALPDQFVLKTTHDSGTAIVCRDKSQLNWGEARKKMAKSLKRDYYRVGGREWPYKNVPRKIIAEPYLEDSRSGELPDYKFFCFDGEPRAMYIATERFGVGETKFDFFDMDFNHLPFENGHPNSSKPIERPSNFELMKELAGRLSAGIPHVRVDFYEVDGKVYFGEMTFYHWSGMVPFRPYEWDLRFGSWINLPKESKVL